jgi:hypothetical protein
MYLLRHAELSDKLHARQGKQLKALFSILIGISSLFSLLQAFETL